MLVILSGALFILAGVLYLGVAAILNGPLSRSRRSAAASDTLEPPERGISVFGLSRNWPGLALLALGSLLMLTGV
ncbi:hypothetical protein G3545_14675 [Starkeya sp. ORNL1]|uniref:hypothetical protein n=1 Tax=Starkeya sp. ORNL1 TaxID=2709380 RepID=UPI0014647CED|nr:hypothetical protein [Starkeya sp. ORNL1]QJP14780.1 hypothetical protein G3545_14675 [Starkeya sp. ORNL1]